MTKKVKQLSVIPNHELEALAQTLYPAIKEFYESQQGQSELQRWQEQQNTIKECKTHENS